MIKRLLYCVGISLLIGLILGSINCGRNLEPVLNGDGTFTPTFGWVRDEAVIAENKNPAKTLHFANTPAGQAVLGPDKDIYLWRQVRIAAGHGELEDWYSNVDQKDVGCCVGCGWKHSSDCLLAIQANHTKREEWHPVSVEAIYGLSRVEIGGGKIRGDGSNGSWAAKAVSTYGVLAMQKYPSIDLTTFSPSRARQLGKSGLSKELETAAKSHPIKGTALVKSWTDVKKAIQQGYPVAVSSDQGFTMTRDSTGRCKPQGTWAHCMCILGARFGANEGGFILNSWGNDVFTGGKFPEDMPVCGFWADANVIDKMVAQADSFALSDAVGFPARILPFDWFIYTTPNRLRQLTFNKFEVAFK